MPRTYIKSAGLAKETDALVVGDRAW